MRENLQAFNIAIIFYNIEGTIHLLKVQKVLLCQSFTSVYILFSQPTIYITQQPLQCSNFREKKWNTDISTKYFSNSVFVCMYIEWNSHW